MVFSSCNYFNYVTFIECELNETKEWLVPLVVFISKQLHIMNSVEILSFLVATRFIYAVTVVVVWVLTDEVETFAEVREFAMKWDTWQTTAHSITFPGLYQLMFNCTKNSIRGNVDSDSFALFLKLILWRKRLPVRKSSNVRYSIFWNGYIALTQ